MLNRPLICGSSDLTLAECSECELAFNLQAKLEEQIELLREMLENTATCEELKLMIEEKYTVQENDISELL